MKEKIVEPCGVRIKKALQIRNMKQTDLCKITNIPKSALSLYISGAYEPKQDRVFLISQALRVDPVWLMGFDVPMERKIQSPVGEISVTEGEAMLLELFRRVPEDRQQLVLQMIRAALGQQE